MQRSKPLEIKIGTLLTKLQPDNSRTSHHLDSNRLKSQMKPICSKL